MRCITFQVVKVNTGSCSNSKVSIHSALHCLRVKSTASRRASFSQSDFPLFLQAEKAWHGFLCKTLHLAIAGRTTGCSSIVRERVLNCLVLPNVRSGNVHDGFVQFGATFQFPHLSHGFFTLHPQLVANAFAFRGGLSQRRAALGLVLLESLWWWCYVRVCPKCQASE